MNARLTEINENEVLLYLGHKGGEVPPEIRDEIHACMKTMMDTASPRVTFRVFDIRPDGTFSGTDFQPEGKDVRELLKDCRKAVFFGATLGAEVEALLRRKQIRNMTEAVILDCCGSSAVENVCDNFCEDLGKEVAPLYLTDRFSPGYGDLPFAQQHDFCRLLDLTRRIGVGLSPAGLMIPQKSVTAVLGIADRPQTKRFRGCAYCSNFKNCIYRKENRSCGEEL